MKPPVYQKLWGVPVAGFHVIEYEGVRYVAAIDDPARPEATVYEPMADPALFQKFADLDATEESVIAFANRYGALGLPQSLIHGEPLSEWRLHIQRIAHVSYLHDQAVNGNKAALAEFVQWENITKDASTDLAQVIYQGPLGFRLIAGNRLRPDLFEELQLRDVVRPSLMLVQQEINEALKQHGSQARLLWTGDRLGIHVVPNSLIAALWLQLAQAVEGNRDFRKCDTCGEWFEASETRRADAKFCSNACRSKAYRDRQRRARELRAGGASLRAIAEQLDSDIQTIKGWVKK